MFCHNGLVEKEMVFFNTPLTKKGVSLCLRMEKLISCSSASYAVYTPVQSLTGLPGV